ncbi:MAG: MFS transporter, partial [Desulfobacteraceae bacterium]|nr:MFS transporter [Desulfobacteraceae bacterium]
LFAVHLTSGRTIGQDIIKGKSEPVFGRVLVSISKDQVAKEAINMIMNALTVVAISLLLLVELLIFVFYFIGQSLVKEKGPKAIHYGLIRPVTFLFLFGIDISISFIPLHMEKLYTPFLGFTKDTIMGLPISVEFFFVGIAIFLCGFWNDRRGWHEPFLVGLFLAGTGVLYSFLAPNVIHFVASRAVVGVGYGFTLLASQGFVIAFSDEKTKAQAFAQFIAGLYAGSICGGATGALLAEKFGYRWVFCIGALILYSIIAYSLIFMRQAMIHPQTEQGLEQVDALPRKAVFSQFFKNRIVLSLIILSSLPAAIAAVGFLNYFSPIYLNRLGASQATIGRVLMVYGFSL